MAFAESLNTPKSRASDRRPSHERSPAAQALRLEGLEVDKVRGRAGPFRVASQRSHRRPAIEASAEGLKRNNEGLERNSEVSSFAEDLLLLSL